MKKLTYYIFLLMLIAGCKERYTPPVSSPETGYLVVEGFINNGLEPTTIKLSRTTKLIDTANIIYEHSAQVTIEGENGESYPLFESIDGIYTSSSLALNSSIKYRLHILTANGKEYLSDYSAVKNTPPIDSISWARENGGVQIYINTHDEQNNTKYYQWEYKETWEFHSAYTSQLNYTIDPVSQLITGIAYRNPDGSSDTTIYKCWQTKNSTQILIGTSEKLITDRIYLPLIYIEQGSKKMSVLYSVNIRQHAISHNAYLFFEKMKKNTEQIGSIFDPQPSELSGNIHCVTNPGEPVIGYVEVSQENNVRKFISNKDLPDWNYDPGCMEYKITNQIDSIRKYGAGLTPTLPASVFQRSITEFYAAVPVCVDCTITGTNIRPDFWP